MQTQDKTTVAPPHASAIGYPGFVSLTKDIRNQLQDSQSPCKVMDGLAERLQAFGKDGLQQTLRAMLEDRPFLIAVGKRSYLHGNGFYKIILADEEDFVLRANIWMPGMHAEENLHDHRWHLASTIITGTLESEIWEEASSPHAAAYDEYIYFGKTSEKDAHMMPIGKTRISLKEKVIHRAGECYNLPSNVMHRIVSTGKTLTSTLMCHPAPARKWGRVISFNPIEPDVERAYLDESQMQDLLEEYLRLCD